MLSLIRKPFARVLALACAFFLATGAFAYAAVGTGDENVNGGKNQADNPLTYLFDDIALRAHPRQGWNSASIDYALARINERLPHPLSNNNYGGGLVRSACQKAINQAISRANSQGHPTDKARVVGVQLWWDSQYVPLSLVSWTFTEKRKNDFEVGFAAALSDLHGYDAAGQAMVKNAFYESLRPDNDVATVCVALNEFEPVDPSYTLSAHTTAHWHDARTGGTQAVFDEIRTWANTTASEQHPGKLTLYWDGFPHAHARAHTTKEVSLPTNGTLNSPAFTPGDFGWKSWQAGRYWFDLTIPQSGTMKEGVDMADREKSETFTLSPENPTKILTLPDQKKESEITASANMHFDARVSAASYRAEELHISDEIFSTDVYIGSPLKDDSGKVKVEKADGSSIPAQITIKRTNNSTKVQAVISQPEEGKYTLVIPTYFKEKNTPFSPQISENIKDKGSSCWIHKNISECLTTEEKISEKISPHPDKVWAIDDAGALNVRDKLWTNNVGADNKVFLPGDTVFAGVNGHIPAGLSDNFTFYSLEDNWSDASEYVDFSDISRARIFLDGKDARDDFDISLQGTRTIAQARDPLLARTAQLKKPMRVTLVIEGVIKEADTHGKRIKVVNNGLEMWNREKRPPNTPPVFIWTPDPEKSVLSSARQGGDQSSIHTQMVFPGQFLEYQVNLDIRVPEDSAHILDYVAFEDIYDPHFEIDESSIEIYDTRSHKAVSRKNYDLNVRKNEHMFRIVFNKEWIKKNITGTNPGWLIARFEGRVARGTHAGAQISNQAFELINSSRTPTNRVHVTIPTPTPDKSVHDVQGTHVNGKVVSKGDHIVYRLILDARPARSALAYDVHKLGMIDDFDERFVRIDAEKIRVENVQTGKDVTSSFASEIKDGKAYIFARPQSTQRAGVIDSGAGSLASYAMKKIDPLKDAPIDQNLLGYQYRIILPAHVISETQETIYNQAWENFENLIKETPQVENPLVPINPQKDVIADEESQITQDKKSPSHQENTASLRGKELPLQSTFLYRLTSSTLPANRVASAQSWNIRDDFDAISDKPTGQWIIQATTSIYEKGKEVFRPGQVIARGGPLGEAGSEYFSVHINEKNILITAQDRFLTLVNSAREKQAGWQAFVQMERIAPGEKESKKSAQKEKLPEYSVINILEEDFNGTARRAEVYTLTPEHPAIDIEKFDTYDSGSEADRDTSSEKLMLAHGEEIDLTLRVKNTGDVPLTHIRLTDRVTQGEEYSRMGEIRCAPPRSSMNEAEFDLSQLRLEPGESLDCHLPLTLTKEGVNHSDTARVQGESIYTSQSVSDEDPWYGASKPLELAHTGTNALGLIGGAFVCIVAGGSCYFTRLSRKTRAISGR